MKFIKYKFVKYNNEFPKLYKKENSSLKKILQKNAKIEHIGSTSVPDLGGKGIIDILVGIKKNQVIKSKNKLMDFGYVLNLAGGNKKRLFFEKDYSKNNLRRVHVHLVEINSNEWKNPIILRDYLRSNKQARKKYEELKKEATKICKNEGEVYRKLKKVFLDKLTKRALNFLEK